MATTARTDIDLGRERTVRNLVGDCARLYFRHPLLFASLALAVVVPVDVALYGLGAGWLYSGYDPDWPLAVDILDPIVFTLVTNSLVAANHVHAVVALARAEGASITRLLRDGVRTLPPVALVVGMSTAGIVLGLFLLILPGLFLIVRWFVAVQPVVLEGRRGRAALRRSGELVKGDFWHVAAVALVLVLVPYALLSALGYASNMLAEALDSGPVQLAYRVVWDAVTASFTALVATLVYFDLRARKGELFV